MYKSLEWTHIVAKVIMIALIVFTSGINVAGPTLHAAPGAIITVDLLSDGQTNGCSLGGCTLREAIADASSGDTIQFSVSGTITLNPARGALVIDRSLTIEGPGTDAAGITIDAGSNFRVFEIYNNSAAIDVNLSLITITGGSTATVGGGILFGFHPTDSNSDGNDSLTLDQVDISGNVAQQGGGIFSAGELIVTRSLINDNQAISDGGGIESACNATILNSTISNNTLAGLNGVGAGLVDANTVPGVGGSPVCTSRLITVDFSTFYGNFATGATPAGGAIYESDADTVTRVSNSILAGNLGGDDCGAETSGILSGGYNFIESAGSGCNTVATDTTGSLPGISSSLTLNGGTTRNHVPTSSSSNVVDKIPNGTNGCGTVDEDQRQYVRPVIGSTGAAGGPCDIGAIEFASTTLPVTLSHFVAEREGELVQFTWQTSTETGNAGFNILAAHNGVLAKLNSELIPSKVIDAVTLTDYAFAASTGSASFYIQEVGIDGAVNESGPFDLGVAYGSHAATASELDVNIYLPVMIQ